MAVGGRTGLRAAEIDWDAHAAGPPAQWPTELRTAVGMALAARFPAVVWFGGPGNWHQIPNDACRIMLGDRHPLTAATGAAVATGIDSALDSMLASVQRTASAGSTTVQAARADEAAARHRRMRLTVGPVFAADGTVCAVFGTITDFDPAPPVSERSERTNVTVPTRSDPHGRTPGAPLSERSERTNVTVPTRSDPHGRTPGTPVSEPGRAERLSELCGALDAATCERDVAAAFLRCPEASLAADAVSLGVIDPDEGTLRIIFVGDIPAEHRDRYHAVALNGPGPMAESVRTGRSVLVQNTAQGQEPHRSVLADFAHILGTLVFNPLRDRAGVCIGALALGWSTPRSVSAAELEVVAASTAPAGPALARVQAAARDRHVAAELQDHLLDLDRSSSAAAVGAVHRLAAEGSRVGGHWYCAGPGNTTDRIALCVGAVVGQGLPAAAAMSRLRTTVTVAAGSTDDPCHVLDVVDRHARTVHGAHGAAVAYAVLDTAAYTLNYVCAANPHPLVVAPDGRIQYLTGGHRPALATSAPGGLTGAATAELPAGALLVLYTATLVELRGDERTGGLDRLAAAAAECTALPVSAVCAHLLDRMAGPHGFTDEVALLAVRPSGVTPSTFVQVIAPLADETVKLRHRLRAWLAPSCPEPILGEILVCVGEAVSNAVDHGSDPNWPHTVSIESFLHPGGLTTTVSDCGRWTGDSSASRREAVRGRGLKLIHALSHRVETVRGAHGTRMTMHHALARDPATSPVQDSGAHRP
jgi:anti-sigma regulatory factor (Ser/Thr protein kinase)